VIEEQKDILAGLDLMNSFIDVDVRQALQSAVVTWGAFERFARCRDLFWTHPANTLPFAALRAQEHMAVIRIGEALHDKEQFFANAAQIASRQALINHRDALSHPFFVKSWYPHIRTFIEENRQHKDLRPALIWDMQRAINAELGAAGYEARNTVIEVTEPMSLMSSLILRLSVKEPEKAPPPEADMRWLRTFRDEFVEFMEAHPDGSTG
jgi:hypothetical protein